MERSTQARKAPTKYAYMVRNYENAEGQEDASWTRIGAVWAHKDGDGEDIWLTALPIDGHIVTRKVKPRENKPSEE